MRRVRLFLASLAWIAIGCTQSEQPKATDAGGPAAQHETGPAGDLVIGEPIRHANLTIFPISSRTPKIADRFITLDAALKAGKVEVMEVGSRPTTAQPTAEASREPASAPADDPFAGPAPAETRSVHQPVVPAANAAVEIVAGGPDVNRLLVLNRADKPLYLMPGEIIIDGQQDRAIGREYVIAPGERPIPMDVFCVEHGRWQDRVPVDTAAVLDLANSPSPVADSVAVAGGASTNLSLIVQQSASGKFVGSVGSVSKVARLAVQGDKDQGAVWDRVAQTNGSSGLSAPSGAFTANYTEPDTIEQLEPYIQALSRPVAERSQIIGVLVAVNGHVETMDVFESTPLFLALWPKLLKSYALDAANAPEEDADKPCPRDDAQQFLAKATAAQSQTDGSDENLLVTTRSTDEIICFSAHDKAKVMALDGAAPGAVGGMGGGMGGMGGGFGGSVHTSGFSK